jgi:hypothetical protein
VAVDVIEVGTEALETFNQINGSIVNGSSIASFQGGGGRGGNTESKERKDGVGELHFDRGIGIGFEIAKSKGMLFALCCCLCVVRDCGLWMRSTLGGRFDGLI